MEPVVVSLLIGGGSLVLSQVWNFLGYRQKADATAFDQHTKAIDAQQSRIDSLERRLEVCERARTTLFEENLVLMRQILGLPKEDSH